MYKWIESGKYFSSNDLRQSDLSVYTNLADNPDINLYADLSKTNPRSDLIRDTYIYIHGSNNSSAYPYFEFMSQSDLPIILNFNMRVSIKSHDISQLGGYDYFFLVDDSNPSLGALGIKYTTAEEHILKPFFIDSTGTLEYPLTYGIENHQWFKVEIVYYNNLLCFKINNRMINTVQCDESITNGFRMKIKGDYFYFDYSNIIITRSKNIISDIPFEVFISSSDVVNGTITLTAEHNMLGE